MNKTVEPIFYSVEEKENITMHFLDEVTLMILNTIHDYEAYICIFRCNYDQQYRIGLYEMFYNTV